MSDSTPAGTAEGTPQGNTDSGDGQQQDQQQPEPTVDSLLSQLEETKKHSRKWEDRAKENYQARKELDQLRESQMTEEQKHSKALSDADKRAAEAEERAEKAVLDALRYKTAAKYAMSDEDAELILTAADEATMSKQAERFTSGRSQAGPRPNAKQGSRNGTGPSTPADVLGDFFESNF